MSRARLVITAVIVEGRKPAEVAAAYEVSRSWLYELLARHKSEGQAAFEPRSRRPHTSPTAVPDRTVEAIVEVRKNLTGQGLDAGPDTIAWHNSVEGLTFAAGRPEILAADVLSTPAKAREFAALLIEAADLAEQG